MTEDQPDSEGPKGGISDILIKAKIYGRKLVVLAHEAELVRNTIPLAGTRITHIVSGHLHKPDVGYLKEKNKDGESVMQVRVGSAFIGMPGWEKVQQPVGYVLTIKKADDRKELVTIEELQIPDYAKDMVAVE